MALPLALIAGLRISFQAGTGTTAPTFTAADIFGVVDKSSVDVQKTEKDLKGWKQGNPGVRALVAARVTESVTTIKFTLEELTQVALDLAFALDGSGAINAGSAAKDGWVKQEIFDGATLVKTITARGSLSLDGNLDLGDDFVKPQFAFKVYGGTVA